MRKWLTEKRRTKRLSQYEVAKLAGISQSYYAAIETGTRGKPLSADVAKKIATALGFDWTLFYEDRPA